MEGRPRGGASLPCPECAGNTEVIITRRKEDKVLRQRRCLKRRCGAKFQSVEQVL